MRGLAILAALLILAATVWLVVRFIRRARADERVSAPWRVETRSGAGVTYIEVVRRRETGDVLDTITVATIPDDSPEWLNLRVAAMQEAQQRATELNDDLRRTS